MQPKMYSPAEAADLYGASDATVKRHCVSGKLPATKLRNGHWIIAESDLAAYARTMGWTPRKGIEDDPWVWVPIIRKGIKFHDKPSGATVTTCGRSSLSKSSAIIKRTVALHYGMAECPVCFGSERA